MCISVDLPEPEGPMTAVSRPLGDLERDAAERVHRGIALAVAADDAAAETTGGRGPPLPPDSGTASGN